jgi:hypothetical protein
MTDFSKKMRGRLWGVMRWADLDALWTAMLAKPGWFAYMPSAPVPADPIAHDALAAMLADLSALLRREHDEDYCGIVYADDLADPTFVKIYDPNHLGSSCSHGAPGQYVPRWVFSLDRPEPLDAGETVPQGRRRWWQRFFGAPSAR